MTDQLPTWEDTEEATPSLPSWEDTEEAKSPEKLIQPTEPKAPAYYGAPTDGSIKYQKQDRSGMAALEGFISGAGESALAGLVPRAVGATQAVLNSENLTGDLGQRYEMYKSAAEGTMKQAQQEAPISAIAGQVAGVVPYTMAAGPSLAKDIALQAGLTGVGTLQSGKGAGESTKEAGYTAGLTALLGRYGKAIGEGAKWAAKTVLTSPARFHGMSTEAVDTLIERPLDVLTSKESKINIGPELEAPVNELRKKLATKQLTKDELATEIRNLQQQARDVRNQMKDAADLEKTALKTKHAQEQEALTSEMNKPVVEAQTEAGRVKAALEESKLARGEATLAASDARKLRRDELKSVGVSDEAVDKIDEALQAQKQKVAALAEKQYNLMKEQGFEAVVPVSSIRSDLSAARQEMTIASRPKMVQSKNMNEAGEFPMVAVEQPKVSMDRAGVIDEFFSKYGEVADDLTLPDAVRYRQAIDDLIDWNAATGAYGGRAEGALKQARTKLNNLIETNGPKEWEPLRKELAKASRLQTESSKLFGKGDKFKTLERSVDAKNKKLQSTLADLETSTGVEVSPYLQDLQAAKQTLQSPLKLDQSVEEVKKALEAVKRQRELQSKFTSQQERVRGAENLAKEAERSQAVAAAKEREMLGATHKKEMETARRTTAEQLYKMREDKLVLAKEVGQLKTNIEGGLSEGDINTFLTQPRNKMGYKEQGKYDSLKDTQPEMFKRIENFKAKSALMEGAEGGTLGRLLKPIALPATVLGVGGYKALEKTLLGPMGPAKKAALQELLREVRDVRESKKP